MTLINIPLIGKLAGEKPVHRVLIIGASYGGLTAALSLIRLLDGSPRHHAADPSPRKLRHEVKITFIDERDGFLHTIGTPLAHTSAAYVAKAWKSYSDIPWLSRSGVTMKRGSVRSIDVATKTATYTDSATGKDHDEKYDFLIAASGMRRKWPIVPRALDRAQYLRDAHAYIEKIVNSTGKTIAVVGGGAVGLEFAAELKHIYPQITVKLIHSRSDILSSEPLPAEFKTRSLQALQDSGVETVLGARVVKVEKPWGVDDDDPARTLVLNNGERLDVALAIDCASKFRPSTDYLHQCVDGVLDGEGYVKVENNMSFDPWQSPLATPSPQPPTSTDESTNSTNTADATADTTTTTTTEPTTPPADSPTPPTFSLDPSTDPIPYHFAVGDIITLSHLHLAGKPRNPIMRRAGFAMASGHVTALNIHTALVAIEDAAHSAAPAPAPAADAYPTPPSSSSSSPSSSADNPTNPAAAAPQGPWLDLPDYPAAMGLALGRVASLWDGTTTAVSEDTLRLLFGDDLGYTLCADRMSLDEDEPPRRRRASEHAPVAPEAALEESAAAAAAAAAAAVVDVEPAYTESVPINAAAEAVKA